MNLADARLKELDNPSLTTDERAGLRCAVAADLIHIGQYEAAREALGDLWRGIGARPNVEGLGERASAEVLLQAGALSGWIGESRRASGAQKAAKDLIGESAALFERLGETDRAAEARSNLAVCFWREGAYGEARDILREAQARAVEDEVRAKIVLRLIVVESSAGRYTDAHRLLTDAAPLFSKTGNHALLGRFHNELAIVLQMLGAAERRADYFDTAIIEYTAAIYHYEQAGHERYKATNENNLAFLLYKLGRYAETHGHLDRARRVLLRLRDAGLVAQVDETKARVHIAEQKYREANRVIAGAVETLEKGGDSATLADALTAQGVAWARLGVHEGSINILYRAVEMAEGVGASYSAAQSALTLIEEHGAKRLRQVEAYKLYLRADKLLESTQDAEDIARLRTCALAVIHRLSGPHLHDEGFTLYGAVHELEEKYIELALDEAGGSVTGAARLLGMRHQSLSSLIESRHRRLLKMRKPVKKRRRSIIKKK